MNASDFTRDLAASAPSAESLRVIGLSVTEAESFRAGYACVPREQPLPLIASNEVMDLAKRWDVGKIEVGMVQLLEWPRARRDGGTQVGLVETDPLIFDASLEFIVEDAETPGHVLWKVARSPSQFLSALATAARFLGDRTIGSVNFDDLEAAKAVASKCASLAGGDQYADFYLMLLGAE